MLTSQSQQKQITLYFLHGYCIALWIIICHIKYCCVLPAEVLRGRTGSGSEAPSTLGVKPGTTAVAVLISLSRLLTPWVDSFHRLPMPCVDSLRRWDTEGPPPRVTAPFRSLLSMLMANRMEFRPEERSREGEGKLYLLQIRLVNHMKILNVCQVLGELFWEHETKVGNLRWTQSICMCMKREEKL